MVWSAATLGANHHNPAQDDKTYSDLIEFRKRVIRVMLSDWRVKWPELVRMADPSDPSVVNAYLTMDHYVAHKFDISDLFRDITQSWQPGVREGRGAAEELAYRLWGDAQKRRRFVSSLPEKIDRNFLIKTWIRERWLDPYSRELMRDAIPVLRSRATVERWDREAGNTGETAVLLLESFASDAVITIETGQSNSDYLQTPLRVGDLTDLTRDEVYRMALANLPRLLGAPKITPHKNGLFYASTLSKHGRGAIRTNDTTSLLLSDEFWKLADAWFPDGAYFAMPDGYSLLIADLRTEFAVEHLRSEMAMVESRERTSFVSRTTKPNCDAWVKERNDRQREWKRRRPELAKEIERRKAEFVEKLVAERRADSAPVSTYDQGAPNAPWKNRKSDLLKPAGKNFTIQDCESEWVAGAERRPKEFTYQPTSRFIYQRRNGVIEIVSE